MQESEESAKQRGSGKGGKGRKETTTAKLK